MVIAKPLSSLSIFFPAYCDEKTIEPLTKKAREVASQLTDDFEIIIVDDHSPDRVGEIANRLAGEFKEVRAIHHEVNRGVGGAMVTGFTSAVKDYVFYTDGDAQYDIGELPLLAAHISESDAVIGYRIKRADGWMRVISSRVFNILIYLFFGIHYRDTDCSFKLIHRRVLEKVKFNTTSGLVDADLLIQIHRLRCPVVEVGVHHRPRPFGQSLCFKPGVIFQMLYDIARLRIRYWMQ